MSSTSVKRSRSDDDKVPSEKIPKMDPCDVDSEQSCKECKVKKWETDSPGCAALCIDDRRCKRKGKYKSDTNHIIRSSNLYCRQHITTKIRTYELERRSFRDALDKASHHIQQLLVDYPVCLSEVLERLCEYLNEQSVTRQKADKIRLTNEALKNLLEGVKLFKRTGASSFKEAYFNEGLNESQRFASKALDDYDEKFYKYTFSSLFRDEENIFPVYNEHMLVSRQVVVISESVEFLKKTFDEWADIVENSDVYLPISYELKLRNSDYIIKFRNGKFNTSEIVREIKDLLERIKNEKSWNHYVKLNEISAVGREVLHWLTGCRNDFRVEKKCYGSCRMRGWIRKKKPPVKENVKEKREPCHVDSEESCQKCDVEQELMIFRWYDGCKALCVDNNMCKRRGKYKLDTAPYTVGFAGYRNTGSCPMYCYQHMTMFRNNELEKEKFRKAIDTAIGNFKELVRMEQDSFMKNLNNMVQDKNMGVFLLEMLEKFHDYSMTIKSECSNIIDEAFLQLLTGVRHFYKSGQSSFEGAYYGLEKSQMIASAALDRYDSWYHQLDLSLSNLGNETEGSSCLDKKKLIGELKQLLQSGLKDWTEEANQLDVYNAISYLGEKYDGKKTDNPASVALYLNQKLDELEIRALQIYSKTSKSVCPKMLEEMSFFGRDFLHAMTGCKITNQNCYGACRR